MPSGKIWFALDPDIGNIKARSGITITASYALRQSSKLLKVGWSYYQELDKI